MEFDHSIPLQEIDSEVGRGDWRRRVVRCCRTMVGASKVGQIGMVTLYPLVNCPVTNWKDPPFLTGKSTISMAIFNSYVSLPEGITFYFSSTSGFLTSHFVMTQREGKRRFG